MRKRKKAEKGVPKRRRRSPKREENGKGELVLKEREDQERLIPIGKKQATDKVDTWEGKENVVGYLWGGQGKKE